MNDELYHQAILELARKARGASRLEAPQASVTVDNPLCGDRVTLDLSLADGRVREVGHRVRGCLLCQAAAVAIAVRAPGET
ncbi:MAG TPA: iron-sulfur cluster assembly scaffold protein, partial [Myxococcota bacterium]|nr:iron-sulfur cluster assembly scaffold protein [Myxococcota bacterium]